MLQLSKEQIDQVLIYLDKILEVCGEKPIGPVLAQLETIVPGQSQDVFKGVLYMMGNLITQGLTGAQKQLTELAADQDRLRNLAEQIKAGIQPKDMTF